MPLRSLSHPPLDWGNTSNLLNFIHHILRSQYGNLINNPQANTILQVPRSINMFFQQFFEQMKYYYINLTIVGSILALIGFYELFKKERNIFYVLSSSFVIYTLIMIYIANFKLAKLSIYVNERFFMPALFLLVLFAMFGLINLIINVSVNFIKYIWLGAILFTGLNFHLNNDHVNYIIGEYTKNILNTVEKQSRLFCMGDNTTFPLAYYYYVKHLRPDLFIIDEYGFVFQDIYKLIHIGSQETNQVGKNNLLSPEQLPLLEKWRTKIRDYAENDILQKSKFPVYYTYAKESGLPEGKAVKQHGIIYKLISNPDEQRLNDYSFLNYEFSSMTNNTIYQDLMDKDMVSIIYLNLGTYLNEIGEVALATKYTIKSKFVSESEDTKKQIYYNSALDYYKHKKYNEAIEELETAIKLDPQYAHAHALLGSIFSDISQTKDAIQEFLQAIKNEPNNAKTWNNLGVEYNKLGQEKQSIESFRNSIKLDPDNYEAYNNLAVIIEGTHQYQEAVNLYEKAIKLNKNYKEAYYNFGTMLLDINKLPEAERYLNNAVQVDPLYAQAYHNLGILYQKKKKYQEAIPYFMKAIKCDNKFADAYFNIGLCYLFIQKYANAEIYFKKNIEIDPNSYIAYKHLGNTYYYLNELQKAYIEWKKAYQLNPGDKEIENNLHILESQKAKKN